MRPRIAVCASGEGTNFSALCLAARENRLEADVVGLICNRGQAGVLSRARALGVPSVISTPRDFPARDQWDQAMVTQLRDIWNVDWVVLAGFLVLIGPRMLATFPRRIVNSHPALLPKFGGPGMYGDHVHAAVLHAGEKETGVTIHWIDAVYDEGPPIAQRRVPVLAQDTVSSLAQRVKAAEAEFYPQVLNDLIHGRGLTDGSPSGTP